MAELPTIHLIHASDAPQHSGKLEEILQKLKAENRIADFTTWGIHADRASLADQAGDDDLVLTLLTHDLEPHKEEIENILRAKDQTPGLGLKIAEVIVDHVPYENDFITFPNDLKPIRSREDMDTVWKGIEKSLKQMFPIKDFSHESRKIDWTKLWQYAKYIYKAFIVLFKVVITLIALFILFMVLAFLLDFYDDFKSIWSSFPRP